MILEINDLSKSYKSADSIQHALKGVNLTLEKGEILGIVGESGSGKSTLLKMISGLEAPDSGQIKLHGKSLSMRRTKEEYRMMQMIFQNAVASFHPRRSIEASIKEAMRNLLGKQDLLEKQNENNIEKEDNPEKEIDIEKWTAQVGLTPDLLKRRPGKLSGGQCQRFAIARAIAVKPEILLCDEITSALDVSTQDQILKLLNKICRDMGTSAIFVSHNLAVVSSLCDRIMVMKDGVVVEEGDATQIIRQPKEEYTKRLIESVLEI